MRPRTQLEVPTDLHVHVLSRRCAHGSMCPRAQLEVPTDLYVHVLSRMCH